MAVEKEMLQRNLEAYRNRYHELFGYQPEAVDQRWAVVERHERGHVAALLEELRGEIQFGSALDLRTQQLVQFGQLIVLGKQHAAALHADAALRAGATTADLLAVAETALLSVGVAGYTLGIEIIKSIVERET